MCLGSTVHDILVSRRLLLVRSRQASLYVGLNLRVMHGSVACNQEKYIRDMQ